MQRKLIQGVHYPLFMRNISAHAEKTAIISVYCFIDPLYIMVLSLANLVKNQRQSTNTTYLY